MLSDCAETINISTKSSDDGKFRSPVISTDTLLAIRITHNIMWDHKAHSIIPKMHFAITSIIDVDVYVLLNVLSVLTLVSTINGHLELMALLQPATKLGEGNIFRSVCQEFCSQGVFSPTLRGEDEGSGEGGLQVHTYGGGWGSGPGGSPGPDPGGSIPECTEADSPPPPADGYCCGRYPPYWDAFLLSSVRANCDLCYRIAAM